MSRFLDELRVRAAALNRRIALPESGDERTIAAAIAARAARLFQPVLIGERAGIAGSLAAAGADPQEFEILEPGTDARTAMLAAALHERRGARGMSLQEAADRVLDPLHFGALMLASGAVDGCVAGAVRSTADVLRAALWCIGPAPGIATVSSAFYMVVPPFRGSEAAEVLSFTDAGVVPEPDAAELGDIALAAVEARRRIVGDEPRVAFLSYSTHGSADGPGVAKVREAVERFREKAPTVRADGELQADAALMPEVGARKAPGSAIAGTANILVFPDLNAGNIAYKLVQRLARAEAIGPILQGLARPMNDLSRGATAEDIVNVGCITALQA